MSANANSLVFALLFTLATALGGGLLHDRLDAERSATVVVFDLNAAMALAGQAVPADIESFYFLPLDRALPDQAAELHEMLARAAAEGEYVGIAGADFDHNLAMVLAAMAAPREKNLAGLVLVYIGPAEHEARLLAPVAGAGARLQFVPYVPPPAAGAI